MKLITLSVKLILSIVLFEQTVISYAQGEETASSKADILQIKGPEALGYDAKLTYIIQNDWSKWSLMGKAHIVNNSQTTLYLLSCESTHGVVIPSTEFNKQAIAPGASVVVDYSISGVTSKNHLEFVPNEIVLAKIDATLKCQTLIQEKETGKLIPFDTAVPFEFVFRKHDLKSINYH